MKLSLVALVVIFFAMTHAYDDSELDAWDAAVNRLRSLEVKRGWFFGSKKKYCDRSSPNDMALTDAYNKQCGTNFQTYQLGLQTASTFTRFKCRNLNDECCNDEGGCKTGEITECCP